MLDDSDETNKNVSVICCLLMEMMQGYNKGTGCKCGIPEPFCEPFLFFSAFWRISFIVTFRLSTGMREKPWAAFLEWGQSRLEVNEDSVNLSQSVREREIGLTVPYWPSKVKLKTGYSS